MDISNGSGGIDSSKLIDYFANDFLKDLGKMVALRDELEKRQGAMKAVDASNKKIAEANAYAESRKVEVDALLADTKAKNADSKTKQATLDVREADIDAKAKALAIADAAFNNSVTDKNAALALRETALANAQAALAAAQATLVTDRANLDARVKALQDKVASINI